MPAQWSNNQVGAQFRLEVRAAFEKENAEWRAEEEAGIERSKVEYADLVARNPDLLEVRDSFYWEIYENSVINIENNSVDVILPNGFAIYPDFITMFGGTSVGWSIPSVGAKLIDGEPRIVIHLILIDYWDDERAAKWEEEHVQDA